MDCRTAESMVNRYINRTLTGKELENFLKHIEQCSSCYDELETYYIVHEATKQLDEEEDSAFDIKGLLKEDIRKARTEIMRNKISNRIAYVLSGSAILVFLGYLLYVILELF